jgi:hypothetical protein
VASPGVVLALAASLALVGCSAPGPSGGTDGTNNQSGGSGSAVTEESAPGDTPDEGVALPPASGVTEGQLPANLPPEIPIIDGPVLVAVDLGTGWAIWIGADDPAAAFQRATAALDAAGFDRVAILSGDTNLASYSSAGYSVQLVAGDDPTHGSAISYTIIRN